MTSRLVKAPNMVAQHCARRQMAAQASAAAARVSAASLPEAQVSRQIDRGLGRRNCVSVVVISP